MYATIEPRLIALLNNGEPSNSNFDDSRPHSPSSLELPPLQDPNILKANGRPLLLEPDASTRNGNPSSSSSNPQRASLTNLIDEGEKSHNEGNGNQNPERRTTERALGISSPQSLRKILGEDVSVSTGVVSNKRPVGDNKDDFVQLPQPPKKQKTVKQVVPPIIIGLFEPPPQAALFPPIASSSFHDRHGRNTLNTTNAPPNVQEKELAESHKDIPLQESEEKNEGQENKGKKTVRARKKWTEAETSTLLLGVNKHGIGNWADILKDPSFSFNVRSATDLKDRFRTCCPAELRSKKPGSEPGTSKDRSNVPTKSKTGLLSENILISEEDLEYNGLPPGDSSVPQNPRAHRKKVEDLAQLGIEGPFKKSLRRERTKFTEEEDREILHGYQLHGPAWSRIQRDPQFHLQSRKPTDLRDRFRNRFPDKWDLGKSSHPGKETGSPAIDDHSSASDKKGKENSDPNPTAPVGFSQPQHASSFSSKKPESRNLNTVLNQVRAQPTIQKPSSSTPSSNREGLRIDEIISPDRESSKGLPLQTQASLFGLKDNFPSFVEAPIIETADTLPFTQSFDWGESTAAPFSGNMGEMDISRILDDAWIDHPTPITNTKEKTSATDLNHIVSAHGDAPSGSTSYFNLICDPEEQIVDLQDEASFG